jgi:hypothetical protein
MYALYGLADDEIQIVEEATRTAWPMSACSYWVDRLWMRGLRGMLEQNMDKEIVARLHYDPKDHSADISEMVDLG